VITTDDVADHLGFAPGTADDADMERLLGAARGVIAPHLLPHVAPLPADMQAVVDTCLLRVCSEMWAWHDTPSGTVTFADGSTSSAPVTRDALNAVLPTLIDAGLAVAVAV
jgi:hypothetical protein